MLAEKALLVDESKESPPKLRLVVARSQVFLSQQLLADRAGVSRTAIKNCENGKSIRLATAYRILKVLNRLRKEMEMPPLQLTDLDWRIFGFEPEELRGK
jgi:DNA-binding XRE family transcriptional regulator